MELSLYFPVQAVFQLPTTYKQDSYWVVVERDMLLPLVEFLKTSQLFKCTQLLDIFALDFPRHEKRYQVNFTLLSPTFNRRFIISVRMVEPMLPSVSRLFVDANWLEREVWDMHGIYFVEHTDLRRLLTDYGFEGFPLLKDYPLSGYAELRYDQELKTCIQEPIHVSQEYRYFDFLSPWLVKRKNG